MSHKNKYFSAGEIARLIKGQIFSGSKNALISGFAAIDKAKAGEITFISNPKYLHLIEKNKASAIVIPDSLIKSISVPTTLKTILTVKNPDLAFSKIISLFKSESSFFFSGVHESAQVAQKVKLGKNVSIGAFVFIENNATISENCVINPHVFIGHSVKIGKRCIIYPNVVIREEAQIGDDVIIHSGAVIGSDGFGYTEENGELVKIPQIGNVIIQDNVEIGANVTIDRARFGSTIIGKSVKIDNLVHIAHNVEIGENTIIIAGAVIAGSTKVGKNVILAGQSGIAGHLKIGDNVRVGAKAGVMKDIPPNQTVAGFPARPYLKHLREQVLLSKLDSLVKKLSKT